MLGWRAIYYDSLDSESNKQSSLGKDAIPSFNASKWVAVPSNPQLVRVTQQLVTNIRNPAVNCDSVNTVAYVVVRKAANDYVSVRSASVQNRTA